MLEVNDPYKALIDLLLGSSSDILSRAQAAMFKKIKSSQWLKKLRRPKSKILEKRNSLSLWDINTYLFNNVTSRKE